jgi:hypothetical protein
MGGTPLRPTASSATGVGVEFTKIPHDEADDDSATTTGPSPPHRTQQWSRANVVVATLVAVTILFVVVFAPLYFVANISCAHVLGSDYVVAGPLEGTTNPSTARQYQIVLFGDSMVGHPEKKYRLSAKIKAFLPQFNVNVSVRGFSGSGIAALQASFLERVLANTTEGGHIDALIMLWDSDASDEKWNIPAHERLAKFQRYLRTTDQVLRRILAAKPGVFLAVAGPLMYGEGPLFAPLRRYDHIYDYALYTRVYEEMGLMNRAMCAGMNITYIDVRSTFLRLNPRRRLGFRGCLTDNGQHENDRGATVVAKEFADALAANFGRTPLWS